RRVLLWDFRLAPRPRLLRGHSGSMLGFAFRPDGRRLAAGGNDRSVKVWDLTAADDPRKDSIPAATITAMASSPSGSLLALAGGQNVGSPGARARRAVLLYDGITGRPVHEFPEQLAGHTCVAFCPSGELIAAGSEDGHVRLWGVKDRKLHLDLTA